jgi:hypothetical protein
LGKIFTVSGEVKRMYRNGKDAMYRAADSSDGTSGKSAYASNTDVKMERLTLSPDLDETVVPHHHSLQLCSNDSTSPSTTTNPLLELDSCGDLYSTPELNLNALQHFETSTTTSDISDPVSQDDGNILFVFRK